MIPALFVALRSQHDNPQELHGKHLRGSKNFNDKHLDEITSEMVEDFKSARNHERRQKEKDGRTATNATVNRALTTLKLLFRRAERNFYAVRNPVVGVAMFLEPLDSMQFIGFEDHAILAA